MPIVIIVGLPGESGGLFRSLLIAAINLIGKADRLGLKLIVQPHLSRCRGGWIRKTPIHFRWLEDGDLAGADPPSGNEKNTGSPARDESVRPGKTGVWMDRTMAGNVDADGGFHASQKA